MERHFALGIFYAGIPRRRVPPSRFRASNSARNAPGSARRYHPRAMARRQPSRQPFPHLRGKRQIELLQGGVGGDRLSLLSEIRISRPPLPSAPSTGANTPKELEEAISGAARAAFNRKVYTGAAQSFVLVIPHWHWHCTALFRRGERIRLAAAWGVSRTRKSPVPA